MLWCHIIPGCFLKYYRKLYSRKRNLNILYYSHFSPTTPVLRINLHAKNDTLNYIPSLTFLNLRQGLIKWSG